jgi:PAS domain S-box-containing protein
MDGLTALLVISGTLAGGIGFQYYFDISPSVSMFSCSIMALAWARGITSAIIATILTILSYDYYFLQPQNSFSFNRADIPQLTFFAIGALLVSILCVSERRSRAALVDTRSKLRESEHQLEEARRDARTTIDSIPAMISTYDPSGVHSFVNKVWTDYTGLTAEQAATGGGDSLFIAGDPERDAWKNSLETGEQLIAEAPIRGKDGSFHWFSIRRTPLRDADGKIVRWYSIGFNIEDRKRAENALRDSESRLIEAERRLLLTLDSIPILAWRARPDGYAEYLNKRWLDFTGLTLADAVGWKWTSAIHPEDMPGLATYWTELLKSPASGEFEARIKRHDGAYRWFLFRVDPLRDASGQILGWYGINAEIERLKHAESALQRSRAYLTEAQKLSKTGSFAWHVESDTLLWSDEMYQIMQIDKEHSISVDAVLKRVHSDDRLKYVEQYERARAGADDWNYDLRLEMPDGTPKVVHIVARRVEYQSGRREIIGAMMDVTATKRSQEQLEAAQSALSHASRVATLGEISATIAHEVNQPLGAIVANGQACLRFLERQPIDIESVRGAVQWVVKDANRAADVIRKVRGLMKKAETNKIAADLNEVVKEVVGLLQRQVDEGMVILRYDLGDVPAACMDRTQISQVIINVILNAIEAMQDVTDRSRILLIRTRRTPDGAAELLVEDVGSGLKVAPDQLFEPFYTTKENGLGMGLTICRSIIEDHGGTLSATVREGSTGSVFRVELPASVEEYSQR